MSNFDEFEVDIDVEPTWIWKGHDLGRRYRGRLRGVVLNFWGGIGVCSEKEVQHKRSVINKVFADSADRCRSTMVDLRNTANVVNVSVDLQFETLEGRIEKERKGG